MSHQTLVVTGGGSAGHITPLLAVVKLIHEQHPSVRLVYIIDRGNPNEQVVKDSGLPLEIKRLRAGKLRRYHGQGMLSRLLDIKTNLLNVRDFFFTLVGIVQALILFIRIRPKLVFSKGGYIAVPVALACFILRKKLITHDSDSIPGLANRIAARFAIKNAVGVSGGNYPYKKSKIVFTGVPVSDEYAKRTVGSIGEFKSEIGLPKDSEVILVAGGSQGAKAVDGAMGSAAPALLQNNPKLYIIHVFGRLNEDSSTKLYKDLDESVSSRVIAKTFLPDMYRYAAAADVVVTRAGATALAEFGVLGKACIVIPAPHLTGGHQLYNAKALEDQEAVIVVHESAGGEQLQRSIEFLLQQKSLRQKIGKKLQSLTQKNSAQAIADLITKEWS